MKKLALFPLFILVAGLSFGFWFFVNTRPVSIDAQYVNFNVPAGAGASVIGRNLHKAGLIKNPTAFKMYIQFTGASASIQAGDYRLSPNLTLFQIASALSKAPLEVRITIQEGLRREEIAAKFAKSLDQGNVFINQFLEESQGMEGYLFPDTYSFSNNATPGAIISKMRSNYDLRTNSLTKSQTTLSDKELLVLASLVERETREGDERAIVSGIMMNRLNAGWPLQIDATVQYAVSTSRCKQNSTSCSWWTPPSSADLDINSPFNTYKNSGLPPAPIANPGLSAIKAAYNPEATEFFYYIHDNQGKIHYARTLEEQNANIDTYLR